MSDNNSNTVKRDSSQGNKTISISEQIQSFINLLNNKDNNVQNQIKGMKGLSQMSRGQYINHEVKENVIEKNLFKIDR